mmetsp:Transcript_30900/g.72289  ORF Transcript_30900/g.72289 Transcript_30900/m.72289 type:complete len:211 (-) Transcript_30900:671-1303(-)
MGRDPDPPSPDGIHPLLPPQDADGRRQRSEIYRPHPRPTRLASALPRLPPLLRGHPVHLWPRRLPALQPLRLRRSGDQVPPRPIHRDGPHGHVRRRRRRPRHLDLLRRRLHDQGYGSLPDHRLPGSSWHPRCRGRCRRRRCGWIRVRRQCWYCRRRHERRSLVRLPPPPFRSQVVQARSHDHPQRACRLLQGGHQGGGRRRRIGGRGGDR